MYDYNPQIHNMNSPREVIPLLIDLVKPQSVLDVGCGTGTWLKAFEEKGIKDYLGVDISIIEESQLEIPRSRFVNHDFKSPLNLDRQFDLVIALEVAEHIEEAAADEFVKSLCNHGTTIVFSAAIPGQDGQYHVNEQWPEYWQRKFAQYGFIFNDRIRPLIWNNKKVDWWYRQNMFLLTREEHSNLAPIMSLVHPEFYELQRRRHSNFTQSIFAGEQGLKLSIQIMLKSIIYKIKSIFGRK